ncbi:polysaccharide deacetylase family protein [Candidatus Moduliflexota bacterium]
MVPLADLVANLTIYAEQPSNVAAITFDDGYANFAEYALPLLEKYDLHATVFVPSAKVGSYNDWDEGSEDFVKMPLLGWEDLRALPKRTVEIGSHGMTHRRLDAIPDDEAKQEVYESRRDLEEGTGRPVTLFAYPHGACPSRWCDRNGENPAKQYRAVCTTRWGRFNTAETVYALRRIGIWDSDSFEDFVDKMSGCYDWLAFKEGVGRFLRNAKRLGGAPGAS